MRTLLEENKRTQRESECNGVNDLRDPTQSRFMHSSGQSGLFFSPLYKNFVEPWSKVDYVPVWVGAAESVLVLQPGK